MKQFYTIISFLALSLLFLLSLSSSTLCEGYVVQQPASSPPNVKQFAQAQLGKLMDLRFVVQSKAAQGANFALQGPLVRLVDHVRRNQTPVLTHGGLSSGVKSLDIVKEGFVIDMNGMKPIPFQNGSWEMAWKQGQRHGSLICAFDLPEHVSRNHASFPACHVFAQFYVWTQEGLVQDQALCRSRQEQIRENEQQKRDARIKFLETTNPMERAKHVRAMYRAMENIHNLPRCDHVPLDDANIVPLDNGLVLSKRGTIWTTARKPNAFMFFGGRPTKAGYATINLVDHGTTDDTTPTGTGDLSRLAP